MKKNLEHSALPSIEEIELYQQGKLNPSRTHEIELLAEENPMLGDAIEGFAALPLFASVPGITLAVSQQAASGANAAASGTKGIVSAAKSNTAWWQLNAWVMGVGVTAVVAITAALIINSSSKSQSPSIALTAQNAPLNEVQIEPNNSASSSTKIQTESANTEEEGTTKSQPQVGFSDNAISIEPDDEQSTYHVAPSTQALALEPIQNVAVNSNGILEVQTSAQEEARLKLSNSSMVAVGIIRIKNYKIADYTEIRKKQWQSLPLETSGLPASFEDESNKENVLIESPIIEIPYLKYLEQCISAYDKDQYRSSSNGFLNILNQYPDDINAQFYGAMSYFHHDLPVLALELFEKAEKNPISTFREETLFYKAKCLKMLNRTNESTPIFKSLVAKNGFYRSQAQKELID